MEVIKRDGRKEPFNVEKIINAAKKAYLASELEMSEKVENALRTLFTVGDTIDIEEIQDKVEEVLMQDNPVVAKSFILYRYKHKRNRDFVNEKMAFIQKYKKSGNTADATIDDNSNVASKNIGILNNEIHKSDNIDINRGMVMRKLKELYPDFDAKTYIRDLEHHIIYKHDESSFAGAIAPYCCSISMYPFLNEGIKDLGGLSASPKNLDSFCGMYINLIFAIASQFAGAVATSEFLVYFDYFARKEWGEEYYLNPDVKITDHSIREKTIRKQIHQYFQQVIYSINQPAAARGMQAAFVNFSYFDKPFFDGMFGIFYFPDGTQPHWESVKWLQKEFMQWFNQERLKTIITFPVESVTLLYKDGKFEDEEMARFVAEEYARGHSFFTYISDSVDSLSSCCFTKDTKVLWKSSTSGVQLTTLEELHNTLWELKKNLRIFHNGSWIKGKSIKLPIEGRKIYKVTTYNNKEYFMSDNHINVTLNGEKTTDKLTTEDYLMFNTQVLNEVKENDEHLTYEMGFTVGAFLGDGSFGPEIKGEIYEVNFSQNKNKYTDCIYNVNKCANQLGIEAEAKISAIHNNVYPIRISSKELVKFICRWTNWERGVHAESKRLNLDCLLQSTSFRKGILAGWYNTDGGNSNRCYTTSPGLAEDMEALITSLGLCSIINVSDRTDEPIVIRGEAFKRNYPLYCIRWYEPSNHRKNKDKENSWVKKNNSMYFKIKSIESVKYSEDIYCIECENENEPYFTLPSGLITHNCRLKNKIQTHEFNFTNGNMGVETGSKSVITLNLNRIVQDWARQPAKAQEQNNGVLDGSVNVPRWTGLKEYIVKILGRVYKYHHAYNEILWDMYDANLLPAYKAGFIALNKQYLTIGINGLNQAAEFLGMKCTDNEEYKEFCQIIFGIIRDQNILHKIEKGHKMSFNCELVPAESLAAKNYNWDKEDGYQVPTDTNLYASYIFKPNDSSISILERIRLHGREYIGDFLDGGSAAHLNLDHHLDVEQYWKLLKYAAENGCQYFTFNIPNCECEDCGFIAKQPFTTCPKCGSTHVSLWDRIIGYLD